MNGNLGCMALQELALDYGSGHPRVELGPHMLPQLAANFCERQSFSVWAVRQHRVDGIADLDDLRADRNLASPQTIRLSSPILPFMVMPHRQDYFL